MFSSLFEKLFVVSQSSPTENTRSREIHGQKENVAAIVVLILSLLLQYNTPGDPADYVHRVGRTARIGLKGNALLFLTPAEVRENDHMQILVFVGTFTKQQYSLYCGFVVWVD